MAFLVRKLVKRDKIYKIINEDINNISADIPTTEFRTTNSTLSTWRIESIDDLQKAVLAIAVSSSEISRMDFIVIDTDILDQKKLSYKYTYAGSDIAVPDLQDMHCDIIDITVSKLIDFLVVYQEIFATDANNSIFIRRFSAGEIKDLLEKAIQEGRVDKGKAKDKILAEIDKIEKRLQCA